MNSTAHRLFTTFLAWTLAIWSIANTPVSVSGQDGQALVTNRDGLFTVAMPTAAGVVRVYLPDDMAAGDIISGTVVAEPGGFTPDERERNLSTLEGMVIEIAGETANAQRVQRPIQFKVKEWGSGPQHIAIILTAAGSSWQKALVPFSRSPAFAPPTRFAIPALAQAGHPVSVQGPFDGNASNTACTVGGQPAVVLAESPRRATFRSPTNAVGPSILTVSDAGKTASGPHRNVGVNLLAPKTKLLKGEQISLTAQVSGLQDLQINLPFRLESSDAVTLSGGNSQGFQIRPSDVGRDGTFTKKFTVTGITPGPWSATGTVQTTPAQGSCYLAGKVVHIENNWGGKKGDWVIGIKERDGSTGYIHIGGDTQPKLKFCDWIKIGGCHTDDKGLIWVDDHEITDDPTRPPTVPQRTPTPTPTPTPSPTPEPIPTPTPCKDGETRNRKEDKRVFEVMNDDSTVFFEVYTDKDSAATAAKNMSDFWKGAKKVGDLITEVLPEGSTVAGWVLGYLDRGSEVLDAILKSPLKDAGVSEVTARVIIKVKKITATCITIEVCEKGKWVTKKTYSETSEITYYRAHITSKAGDDNWEKITNSSDRLDRAKLGKWAQDWLKDQLNILKTNGESYLDFKNNCK